MEQPQKKILITGGAGFIGSNFLRFLYHKYPQYRMVNLDLLSYAGNSENLRDIEMLDRHLPITRYHFVQGDICDEQMLEKLFSEHQFGAVVHFAAESHVDRSIFNVLEFVRTNIDGTRALLEAVRRFRVPRMIHISTDEVYGSIPEGRTADEETPLRPSNPYAASKAGADLLVQTYMKTFDLPAIVVRGSNNYGPFQYPEKLIPIAITNIIEGKKIPVHGTGEHVRSWLHVEDFVRAIDLILHRASAKTIYNVSGEERTNLEVLTMLTHTLKKDDALAREHVNDRPGADLRYAPNSKKLTHELGWTRAHHFEESIAGVVQWYLGNQEWWRTIRLKKGFLDHYERQSRGQWC